MRTLALFVGLAVLAGQTVRAGEAPAFAAKPSAKSAGGKVTISFAAEEPVDAAVWITQGDRTVRHLAAGMLGENAPAPFEKGLEQSVQWDMTDDAGRPVGPGPFRVHVGLGTEIQFDRMLGDSRDSIGFPSSLAVNRAGQLHFLWQRGNPFYGAAIITRHDRDGRYEKTILPYGADLPETEVSGFGRIRRADGKSMPLVSDALANAIQPLCSAFSKPQTMTFLPDGRLVFSSGVGNATNHGPAQHLLTLLPDGSCPPDGMVQMRFSEPRGYLGGTSGGRGASPGHLASDPKGRWIYFSGVEAMGKRYHGVFRFELSQAYLPKQAWLGDGAAAGDDDKHFNRPEGIATDAEGNLYVCDWGNRRVLAFSPQGVLLGTLKVDWPKFIAVHPEKGTVYVLSHFQPDRRTAKPGLPLKPIRRLSKFDSIRSAGPAATLDLPKPRMYRYDQPVMALDSSGETPRLWIAGDMGRFFARIEDQGEKLLLRPTAPPRISALGNLTGVTADPNSDRLILKTLNYFGLAPMESTTGRLGSRFTSKHTYMPCFDGVGNLHLFEYRDRKVSRWYQNILRYSPDGRPRPFSGTGANAVEPLVPDLVLGNHFNPWGSMSVTPQGEIYALVGDGKQTPMSSKIRMYIHHYGADGKLRNEDVIPGLLPGQQAIQVDREGNIYVGMNIKRPAALHYPPFAGQVPDRWFWQKSSKAMAMPWAGGYTNAYLFAGGAIAKFGPEGGALLWEPRAEQKVTMNKEGAEHWLRAPGVSIKGKKPDIYIKGHKWVYRGFGPSMPGKDYVSTDAGCVCIGARFKLDRFGRLWVPDALQFSVGLVDGAGNEILRFGQYGNQDSLGAGSRQPVPSIPMYWPIDVDTRFPYAYVADYGNMRVVRVKVGYRQQEACGL